MKYLLLDQWRKIRSHWINFLSLSLLVVAITLTFTAVKTSIRRLDENYDTYLEEQQLEDFYFNMGQVDVSVLSGRALWELCQELNMELECGIAISLDTEVAYNNLNVTINQEIKEQPEVYESLIDQFADQFVSEFGYTYEKQYVSDVTEKEFTYKFVSVSTTLNIPYVVEGEIPKAFNEIALFPEFAEANSIQVGDTVTIKDVDYLVTGFIYRVDYLFPIFSLQTITFDPAKQTLVLATKETMDQLDEFLFIKYSVRGDLNEAFPDFGYSNIQSNDYSVLGQQMAILNILMPSDINFRVISLDLEITNANAFVNIFLPMFTMMIGLLLLIFMRRYIDQNKEDLAILHALGYSDNELTISLMLYPTMIALTSIIGYIVGVLLSDQLFEIYAARYLFPKADFKLYLDLFVYAAVLPTIFIIVANYIFIRLSLRHHSRKQPVRWLRISKFVETKTILYTSILFLTISLMLLFGLSGNSMFTDFVDYTKTGNNYKEMINLQYMTNENLLDSYERYTKTLVKIEEVNSVRLKTVQTSSLYGMSPETTLKRLINDDIHSNFLLEDGVIVSEYLHTLLNLDKGDMITIRIGEASIEQEVQGVSNELLENNLFISSTTLNEQYGLDESYYNGLFTSDYDYQSPFIVSRIDYANSLDEFAAILNISSIIINYLVVLSMVLSLFVFTLILINYFTDHRIDIAILKSLGYNNIEIHKKYLLILYIIMIVLFISSIPLTDFILNYLLSMIMDSIGFKLVVSIRVISIVIGATTLHIIFALVTYYATKYYDSIHLSELLKHNIK